MFGPAGDRVAQLLAEHALEGGHLTRLVQPTQQVVERAVLEHDHNDVIQSSQSVGIDHRGSSSNAWEHVPSRAHRLIESRRTNRWHHPDGVATLQAPYRGVGVVEDIEPVVRPARLPRRYSNRCGEP